MENEDVDPVGRDPLAKPTAAAVALGIIREGDKLDQVMVDFWMRAVDASATVADRYPNPDCHEDTVGDAIRAELHE